ncbi:MAG TPA: DUF5916 domain-containing protein [Thermoanaerobaculia bacterium]|nr:DUF5916 domain-containing protein [Thermoanaerobaculia bacterium]
MLATAALGQEAETGSPAALAPKGEHAIRPTTSEIRVDGLLDEAAWADATVVPLTHEWSPGNNVAAPVATECLVTFDDDNLYVGFRAHDPEPGRIRAYLADRDTAFLDDSVGFQIDTFNDQRRAYQFRVNPLGVQMDGTINDVEETEDWTWDAIWDSKGRITADGYVVEIALPLKQIRFARASEAQAWGFLAQRTYPRSVVHDIRSTWNNRQQDCQVCQFETITGFRHLEAGYNLETTPTLTSKRTDARPALTQPIASGDEEIEAGLSVRWGIRPNVSLNATVNPDFSQVEADFAVLDVNERFALSFPEKRPFFLEGADFFATAYNAVFTRTVFDPKYGLKLTGKQKQNAFGVFLTEDRINALLIPGREASAQAFLDEEVSTGVLRWRRDIGATSALGVLYAGRDGDDYSNQVYGVDGSVRLTPIDTIRFQALGSRTEYPLEIASSLRQSADPFSGEAWIGEYAHVTRDWMWRATYNSIADGFRADSGFMPQVGFEEASGQLQRTFWGGKGDWYTRFFINVNSSTKHDKDGDLLEEDFNMFLQYDGPMQSVVRLRLLPNNESFLGNEFFNYRQDLLLAIRPSGHLGMDLFLRQGEVIDFVNVRQVDFVQIQPSFDFRIGRHVFGDFDHNRQEFFTHGERYLKAELTQAMLRYHLNVRTFVRAILQYRDVERDLDLFRPGLPLNAEEETFFSQFLFSYKLNPQTVFLAGYSDNYLGTQEIDLTQRDRTFFLKLGYAVLW